MRAASDADAAVPLTPALRRVLADAAGDRRLAKVRGGGRGGALSKSRFFVAPPTNPPPSFPQPTRDLAASLLADDADAAHLPAVRTVFESMATRLPAAQAPSLAAVVGCTTKPKPPPSDPAVAARHDALRAAAEEAAYARMVADVTAGERAAAARGGSGVGQFRQQLALGLHVAVAAGTGFAAGWTAAGGVWREERMVRERWKNDDGKRGGQCASVALTPPSLSFLSAPLAASSA